MQEGVILCVLCVICVLCYGYEDPGYEGISDHEQSNDDLRNRSKIWTVHS